MQDLEFKTGVIRPVECVKEGYALIKDDYWILFVVWIVGSILSSISLLTAAGAMMCGIFYCYLRAIDGNEVKFDDLWKGMQWFLPGLVVMLVIVVPILVVYGVVTVPVFMAAAMGGDLSDDELMRLLFGALAVEFVLLVIMVCLHTLLMFAFPLIVDRNLGAVAAMKMSARAVFKNMNGVLGLIMVNFGLVLVGVLAFCVGLYFVIPVVIAGNVVAYRKVFPKVDEGNYAPPPPDAYGGMV